MSLIEISAPFDRIGIEASSTRIWIKSYSGTGRCTKAVSLRLTSRDRDALIAALRRIDTSDADADATRQQRAHA